jgi:hypothetical protein
MKDIHASLGIKTALSTAYHPQSDGQTERVNQEIELYLQNFCNHRQTDWAKWLPYAEFTLNNWVNQSTKHSAFELIYGYTPNWEAIDLEGRVPTAGNWIKNAEEKRKEAQAAMEMAREIMAKSYNEGKKMFPDLEEGQEVWLNTKNLKLDQPSKKLGRKWIGPYQIVKKLGDLNYQLKLPQSMKIHDVFHVHLLKPHHPSSWHQKPLPPVEVEGEEEYEMEEVLNSRIQRGKLEFLVTWKGYLGELTWVRELDMHADDAIKQFYKANPGAPQKISAVVFGLLPFQQYENLTEWQPKADCP